jgi:hypothetical protein
VICIYMGGIRRLLSHRWRRPEPRSVAHGVVVFFIMPCHQLAIHRIIMVSPLKEDAPSWPRRAMGQFIL